MIYQRDDWEFQAIQNRYQDMYAINLSLEQARIIFDYEQTRDSGSGIFFSFWEEMDFEQASFRDILSEHQLQQYVIIHETAINQYEKSLVESDIACLPQLNAAKDLLKYYQEILLTRLHKALLSINFNAIFFNEKEKTNYLKAAYKKYLVNEKKKDIGGAFQA